MTDSARLRYAPMTLARLHLALTDRAALAADLGAAVPAHWPSDDYRGLLAIQAPEWACTGGDGGWSFIVILRDTNTVVGEIGTKGEPDPTGAIEIGCGLLPEARGLGLATEATEAMVQFAAGRGATRVLAYTRVDNVPSHACLVRSGFVRCGEADGEWIWERRIG